MSAEQILLIPHCHWFSTKFNMDTKTMLIYCSQRFMEMVTQLISEEKETISYHSHQKKMHK